MIQILDMSAKCSDPALSATLKLTKSMISVIGTIAPIVLLTISVINIIRLVINPDEKKNVSKIKNSLIAAVVIFMVPVLVNVVMQMLDENFTVTSCWNSAGDYNGPHRYIKLSDQRTPSNIFTDPSAYQGGEQKPSSSSGGSTIEGTAQKVGDVEWDPNNVTKKSNLTSTQLVGVLNAYGGNAKNFIPYAQALITAENKYNVNVFFLIGLEAFESGWITSSISQSCNNLGGVCESSSRPSNGCGSNYNCSFAKFSSVNDFIDYHGNFLKSSYLTPGASYYEGTSISQVYTKHYCPECYEGASGIKAIADGLFSKVSSVLGG